MNKKLVVYFSYTGHTKMIVDKIKEKLDCDILEIETVVPYSTDYDMVVMMNKIVKEVMYYQKLKI